MATIHQVVEAQKKAMAKIVRGSIFKAGAQIESMSPVDEGTFKANWMTGISASNTTITGDTSRIGSKDLAKTLESFKMGGVLYYTNNLPYAEPLEYGYSEQAPAGMVRLTVRNIQQYVDEEKRKL